MKEPSGGAPGLWPAGRFGLLLLAIVAGGLGSLAAAAPARSDLLAAAAVGAAFGASASFAGYFAVGRSAERSAQKAVQTFLAVMAGKVIAFAAFLLTLVLTTALNPVALATGLVGATLAGECLLVVSLRRAERAGDSGGHRP